MFYITIFIAGQRPDAIMILATQQITISYKIAFVINLTEWNQIDTGVIWVNKQNCIQFLFSFPERVLCKKNCTPIPHTYKYLSNCCVCNLTISCYAFACVECETNQRLCIC